MRETKNTPWFLVFESQSPVRNPGLLVLYTFVNDGFDFASSGGAENRSL
jgi:hypothetical protein